METEMAFLTPGEVLAEIESCLAVIKEGDAVNLASAAEQLPLAATVAVARDDGAIVAVGAIKQKRSAYASGVAESSGFPFNPNTHELGYVAVKASHRNQKLSRKIAAALLGNFSGRPLFATTSNPWMKRTLESVGFVRRGQEWPGKTETLSLWIKE